MKKLCLIFLIAFFGIIVFAERIQARPLIYDVTGSVTGVYISDRGTTLAVQNNRSRNIYIMVMDWDSTITFDEFMESNGIEGKENLIGKQINIKADLTEIVTDEDIKYSTYLSDVNSQFKKYYMMCWLTFDDEEPQIKIH